MKKAVSLTLACWLLALTPNPARADPSSFNVLPGCRILINGKPELTVTEAWATSVSATGSLRAYWAQVPTA